MKYAETAKTGIKIPSYFLKQFNQGELLNEWLILFIVYCSGLHAKRSMPIWHADHAVHPDQNNYKQTERL